MMATEIKAENAVATRPLNILLIGNNPKEVGDILDKINEVRYPKINTEIAFNLRTMLARLIEFEPHYVLMDDNIGKTELKEAVNIFAEKRKTLAIPITILKNSNYHDSVLSSENLDYVLKQNFSIDLLMYGFKNFLKNKEIKLNMLSKAKN